MSKKYIEYFQAMPEEKANNIVTWIEVNLTSIKSINKEATCSRLRTLMKNYTGITCNNKEFCGAMEKAGFKIVQDFYFNVSSATINKLEKELDK